MDLSFVYCLQLKFSRRQHWKKPVVLPGDPYALNFRQKMFFETWNIVAILQLIFYWSANSYITYWWKSWCLKWFFDYFAQIILSWLNEASIKVQCLLQRSRTSGVSRRVSEKGCVYTLSVYARVSLGKRHTWLLIVWLILTCRDQAKLIKDKTASLYKWNQYIDWCTRFFKRIKKKEFIWRIPICDEYKVWMQIKLMLIGIDNL